MTHWNSDQDIDDDDDAPEGDADDGLMDCPYCGAEMYDDSPRCPACGKYLSQDDAPPERKPAWILITAVVLLIVMLAWASIYL